MRQESMKIKVFFERKGYNVVSLDFKVIDSKSGILSRFKDSLNFPSSFGNNWDALYDHLTDLSWLKAKETIILLVSASEYKNKVELKELYSILVDAQEWWSNEKVSFGSISI